jgi:hypothetical protein
MCKGNTQCKACQQNSIGKMAKKQKRRSYRRSRVSGLNTKGIMPALTQTVLPVSAGFFAGDFLINQINNPTLSKYGSYIKLGAGLLLAASGSGMGAKLGIGLAGSGVVGVAKDLMDGSSAVSALPFPVDPYNQVAGTDTVTTL